MSADYYAETQRIIEALADEGFVAESRSLSDVMDGGSTSTEILMGIRWRLQQIDVAEKTGSPEIKCSIRALLSTLNQVLSA